MSIREQHAARCQTIDIRRLCLRMPAQASGPVIEVVNRDEQDVWFRCFLTESDIRADHRGSNDQQSNRNLSQLVHLDLNAPVFFRQFAGLKAASTADG